MNTYTRGIRNAFRNLIRTFSIVFILGLSVGLSIAMLVAHQTVSKKIASIKANVGNNVIISPAGVNGFQGGGNPLTNTQANQVSRLAHVSSAVETISDRFNTTNSNLVSAIDAGSLGKRFNSNPDSNFSGNFNFTPPVDALGTNSANAISSLATRNGETVSLTSGALFNGNSTDDVAIIGSSLATKNNLKVGSTFTAYNTSIKVVGIYTASTSFANNQVLMPLATLQNLSTQQGQLTEIILTVDSISNVDSVTNAVKNVLGSAADVTNSAQQAQNSITPLQNIQSISVISLIAATVSGGVIIFLTMVMIVRERRREIGVLKAIGASNAKVMEQFVTEATTLTFMGALVGMVVGFLSSNSITTLLANNSSSSSSTATRGFGGGGGRFLGGIRNNLSNLHAVVGWNVLLYGLLIALVIAVIGSALASMFIARIKPAEVMRVE